MRLQDNLDEERQMVNDNATEEVQTGNRQSGPVRPVPLTGDGSSASSGTSPEADP